MSIVTEAQLEGDRLTVTIERQIGEYADHTTVRAHHSVSVPAAQPDESLVEYQARIGDAVKSLAFPLHEAVLLELGIEYEYDSDGYLREKVIPGTQVKGAGASASVPQSAPRPAAAPSAGGVKVMEKDAPTAAPGKAYGRIDPATAKPWVDPAAIAAAEAAGADTLWTGVTKGRRWYRFNDAMWNKPQDDQPEPQVPADDQPF